MDELPAEWREAEFAIVKRTLVLFSMQVASWLEAGEATALLAVAREVRDFDGSQACCPCCQETTCDDDCPLAPIRNRVPGTQA